MNQTTVPALPKMDPARVKRVREWLATDRPLLTWAPLLSPTGLVRHAWVLVRSGAVNSLQGAYGQRTACGILAPAPTTFSDISTTPDCEACRDEAARPLVEFVEKEIERSRAG